MACGGAALASELAWKLESLGWQLTSGYGLTETASVLTLNPPGTAKIGSVGRPLAGVELRIDPLFRDAGWPRGARLPLR
jgi:long-chain acyl-CoA synthetase